MSEILSSRPRAQNSVQAERVFYERVRELGGTVLEEKWLGANTRHRVRCTSGHETTPLPSTVRSRGGICRVCSGRDSQAAEAAFRARVAELGGVVVEPLWLGNNTPHKVRCAAGHDCSPHPSSVKQGRGICRICVGLDSGTAERAFRDRVESLGGTVLEADWLGSKVPHLVRCANGHEGKARPADVQKGRGLCRTCGGNDPKVAERAFRNHVAELGGVVLEPKWLGANAPHRVRCAAGHESTPRPGNVRDRGRICRTCANRDPLLAEREFRARVDQLGGNLLESSWLGVNTPHRVICARGHECYPRPGHLRSGRGICRSCAGKDPVQAERDFHERLARFGGTLLETKWLGSTTPHRVLCVAGHLCKPRPSAVQQGQGICRGCASKEWDVFYVVKNADEGLIKFGITSGNPRPRLQDHSRDGYRSVVRILTKLPDGFARSIEQAAIVALRRVGERPAKGREYYNARATGLVLDVADNYPDVPPGLMISHLPVQQAAKRAA